MDQPLRKLVSEYPGNRVIQWLPTTTAVFENLKKAVWECSTLFFVDSQSPVFLHTDACDYGIGGYLYQVIDGAERPIGFMSKALHGAELNWSTIEKEAYAIWKSLKQFEYLLRDIKFRIRTDHKNLLYLNEAGSRKVLSWKLDIQQFNFDVEHIPGRNNEIADAFSRLCTIRAGGRRIPTGSRRTAEAMGRVTRARDRRTQHPVYSSGSNRHTSKHETACTAACELPDCHTPVSRQVSVNYGST
jgi:hypothetical protein